MYFDKQPTKGRPILKLNNVGLDMVKKLAAVMCTEEEIASVLEVTVEVLHNRVNKESFSDAYKSGRESGKASLRRAQFELARKNANMAIWLGKQYLGQKDKTDEELEMGDKVSVSINIADCGGET